MDAIVETTLTEDKKVFSTCIQGMNDDSGLGNPYGVVDMGCHVWKQCLKCAESLYGEECTAQNIKYNVKLVTGQYECQNAPGTCRKAICECDLAFAQFTGKSEYDLSFLSF